MIRAIILKGKINNTLWPKIVLAITQIKNLQLICILEANISSIKIQNQALPNIKHLYIPNSRVYVFLHKEKQS